MILIAYEINLILLVAHLILYLITNLTFLIDYCNFTTKYYVLDNMLFR
jgi:hypothetical protein